MRRPLRSGQGTKTVIGRGRGCARGGGAMAEEIAHQQSSDNTGYSATDAQNLEKVFAADDVLNMTITGKDNTRAYGLLATVKSRFIRTRARSTSIAPLVKMQLRLIASKA